MLPTIVLLHPAQGDHRAFDDVLPFLAGRDVVVPCLPGRPGSDGPHPVTAERAAAWVLACLAELGVARAVVAGHSVGGAIAIELALACARGGGVALSLVGLGLVATGARLRVGPDILRANEGDETALADWRMCDGFDRLADIGAIHVPTVVVSGSDDPLTPPKYAAFLRDRIAGARLVSLDGAGHYLPSERPADVAAALLSL